MCGVGECYAVWLMAPGAFVWLSAPARQMKQRYRISELEGELSAQKIQMRR